MIVALFIRKKWARGLIHETDMETQKIEATIKMDVIINNTKGAPVMGIEPIEPIETIDVIINNTKGIPVIGIETTEITVVAIKTTKTTRHRKHMTSIQIFYPNNQ